MTREAFSDASASGYGVYVSGNDTQNSSGSWTDSESVRSSTWRELQAVNRLLVVFSETLRECNVRWNVDNKNVLAIISADSMKPDLQDLALEIYHTVKTNSISLFTQWILREVNTYADLLSKPCLFDSDDWQISQAMYEFLTYRWGRCTADRFASCTIRSTLVSMRGF